MKSLKKKITAIALSILGLLAYGIQNSEASAPCNTNECPGTQVFCCMDTRTGEVLFIC